MLKNILVSGIDYVTPDTLNKEKIKETVELATTSRSMMSGLGVTIIGVLTAITPYLQEHISTTMFGIFTTVVGVVNIYFRATTVTPKGKLGLDEKGVDDEK